MRKAFIALIRLSGVVGAAACLLAIGLAHFTPAPTHYRLASAPAYAAVNWFVLEPDPGYGRFIDAKTGAVSRLAFPDGDRIDYASCSPWVDENGESQIVGRWSRRGGEGGDSVANDFGLARYSLPSGRVLDQIPLEVVPASHPCWFPGTVARVLYAGSDGHLYRLSFENAAGEIDQYEEQRAELVSWRHPGPAPSLTVRDPIWPSDHRLGRRLIVVLAMRARPTDPQITPGRLWWLQLDREGRTVIDGAPLTDPADPMSVDRADERYPTFTVTPDGRRVLAYLCQPRNTGRWELRLAPLHFDPKTGVPTLKTEESQILTPTHLAARPSFSSDSRSIYAIVEGDNGAQGSAASVVRFPTTDAEAAPAAASASAAAARPSEAPHG